MGIAGMTEKECGTFLAGASLGRLGCALGNQPYVVPIYFVLVIQLTATASGFVPALSMVVELVAPSITVTLLLFALAT